jgi:cobalt-zinc-cadmium efflux system membrane fusion protein
MKNVRMGQIVVGIVLGAALGGSGMWWWRGHGASALRAESAGHAEVESTDEHGHGAPAEGEDRHAHEAGRIVLSEKAIRDSGIEVAETAGGEVEQSLTLPGEIVLNADKVAHIVPRVAGVVRRVDKNLGDEVQAGEVMAILESRELAEAKAACLAAQQRLMLAEANLKSAEELHTKKIMPDLEFLTIQKAKAETEIELKTTENKLQALGVPEEQVKELPNRTVSLAVYELRAPFAGTVVEKHCSLGEVLNGESDAFMLADLSIVWANITVYSQDMGRVRVGQSVHLRSDALDVFTTAVVNYVAPVVNEATRTIHARADVPNADRRWRPGTFVTAALVLDQEQVPILIPTDAVQRVKGETVVFVAEGDAFEPRPVKVGRVSATHSEIVAGLEPGQKYVVKGAVVLKAELGKSQAAHEH